MKVKNKTNYDTRFLQSLFIKCDKHEGANPKYREVCVYKSKRNRVHGRAWIRSRYIDMYLPDDADIKSVVRVYIHELGHNLGLRHKDMVDISLIDTAWITDIAIPLKKQKLIKPKSNIIEVNNQSTKET